MLACAGSPLITDALSATVNPWSKLWWRIGWFDSSSQMRRCLFLLQEGSELIHSSLVAKDGGGPWGGRGKEWVRCWKTEDLLSGWMG